MDKFNKFIDILTHKLPDAPKYAKKYEIVVVGKSLGVTFTRHLSAKTHGHNYMMLVNSGGKVPMEVARQMHEQTVPLEYMQSVSNAACGSVALSDNFKATQFLPDENALVLGNGRRVR